MGIKDGKPCKSCGKFDYYPSGKCKTCHDKRMTKWRGNNQEKPNEYARKWKSNNPEKLKISKSKYKKSKATKEKNTQWRIRNIEKIRQYISKYTAANKDKRKALKQKRRTSALGAGGSFTAAEWNELCKSYNYKCVRCGRKEKLTADHIKPVSKGGDSNISNIQPLCRSCNSSKGAKVIDYK